MSTPRHVQRPELLAPAGSLEAFFAALEAGADAVYTGLKDFSARAKAKNFSLGDLSRMTWLAQGQDKRLYVTLNTLVKETELPQLIDTLGALEEIGVDAVILQDLAVWKLARDHFPGLKLHASTQMTIHNRAGVRMLERLGFTRGVLARELTLEEITAIREQTHLELEHFIHGALCFSFSGQCYFSSYLSGKSGNRGRCAQPCRRLHRHRQQQGYYFSPNDLSAIDLLPGLQQAGICSFKIEGRMKSAEYVHKVVNAYRRVLDAPAEERAACITEGKQLLKESFGRQPTRGFLTGHQPADLVRPDTRGATGRFLGHIDRVRNTVISFSSSAPLHLGDRLRVQPASDKSGTAFTIRELLQGSRSVRKVPAGRPVQVPSPFSGRFKKGDAVFMVSSGSAFSLSDAACRRRLERVSPPLPKLNLYLEVSDNRLTGRACLAGREESFSFSVDSYPAERQPLDITILRRVFAATDDAPFTLGELSTGTLPPVVIPPKQLKQIRRALYQQLRESIAESTPPVPGEHRRQALSALLPESPPEPRPREIRVQLRDSRDQRILKDPAIGRILLPATRGVLKYIEKLPRERQRVIWDLPFVVFDRDWPALQETVDTLIASGFRQFRLNNLSHFALFDRHPEMTLFSGYRLFALNSQALCALAEQGIGEAELYIEDERTNLFAILARKLPIPTALTVFARPPLLTSRAQIKQVRAEAPVLSDRGEAFRVEERQGLTWLTAEEEFSFLGNLPELETSGCHHFLIDLSHCGAFSARGHQVLDALRHIRDPEGTRKFNYLNGLE